LVRQLFWLGAAWAAGWAGGGTAAAGPPFRTDDPEPIEMQHWEINFFSLGTFNRTEHSGALAGIDANYGLARDLEVHSTFFLGYNANAGESTAIGMGGLELGIKYRFLSPSEEDWWPQIASRRILACRRSPPARTRRRGRSCVGSLAQHLIRRMPKGNCRIIVRRWSYSRRRRVPARTPALKAFAQKTLPILQQHLQMVEALNPKR